MPAASIRKSRRRIGALAVEANHRLHDRACCGPSATQGPCLRDSIVVVSVWPGLQGVYGHFATQVAVEPPNRTSTGPSEGGRFITRRNLPGHRLHRAESLFTSLQGSRRCPARHLATSTSLLGRIHGEGPASHLDPVRRFSSTKRTIRQYPRDDRC